jgi:trehalose synthase
MDLVPIKEGPLVRDYKAYASLAPSVNHFLDHTSQMIDQLKGKTVWMINSTAQGGGVAEMLPSQIRLYRELGAEVNWLVLKATDQNFFTLTKQLHNSIHGKGVTNYEDSDHETYLKTNESNLKKALEYIKDGDIVVVHDPQPASLGPMIKEHRDVKIIWRCHIGLELHNDATRAAWTFLKRYLQKYDHFVFTAPEYIPDFIAGNVSIIPPAIDPLSHKNRKLLLHKCIGILHQAGVINEKEPVIYDFYDAQVRRVQPDGSFGRPDDPAVLDIIFRPTITQISRWDALKGWLPLMKGFIKMKSFGGSEYGYVFLQFKIQGFINVDE